MKRAERLTIANETVAILERGTYRGPSGADVNIVERLNACKQSTKLFLPDELSELLSVTQLKAPPFKTTSFEVRNETSLEGSASLAQSGHKRVMVLNFASAKNPGGGFLNGSQAQEETLARSSALYASLLQCRDFYDFHRSHDSLLYTDRMIYSPDCPIFRDDSGRLLDAPYAVDFVTSPAPNAGAIAQNQPQDAHKIPATLRIRAEKMLALAAHFNCSSLVLGAWGCGVFKNSPRLVAGIFKELLTSAGTFHGRFDKVLFSVYDSSEDLQTFGEFKQAFT